MFFKETNFKETAVGQISKDWDVAKVMELGEVVTGTTPSTFNKEYWDGEYPFVTPTDITEIKYVEKTERQVTQKGVERGRLIPKDSVLVTCIASIGKIALASEPCITNQQINAIVCREKTDSQYTYYAIAFRSDILRTWAGMTTNPIVKKSLFEKFSLAWPKNKNERQKIAEILSTVDDAIQGISGVIAKTERLKKGLMHHLLTKGIRHEKFRQTKIGEIPEKWGVVKLKDVGSPEKNAIVDGPFGSSVNVLKDYIESGVPVIRINNIAPFKFIEDDLKYISEEKFDSLKRSAVKPGDILLSKVGTIGYACIFPDHIPKAILSTTGSCKITVSKDKVVPEFVGCYLNHIKPYMERIASQSVQPFLNMEMVKNLPLVIPPLEEQQKIADIIFIVDKKLELERNEKARLERIKQGMMDLLLKGKVRVKVN